MRAKISVSAALVFILSVQSASQNLIHPLRARGEPFFVASGDRHEAFRDTLKILAIMVQFQSDADPLTSGDGRFDLSTASQRIIDAPPRDSAYFASHLLFARNYFRKASAGKQTIAATVLGSVFTLSKQMQQYSPRTSNLPIGQLIEESWQLADSAYASFPFQDFDLFVIFHAGSGRDIDLRSALLYDPTPYDLPSLYFDYASLKNIFGPTYVGVQLKNHPGFSITNSAVLPETENRMLPSSDGGSFLYQLGINGLIVANIGSCLGLPDLFDTKTGRTAIGRFGLMDGQSIFSFFGLFPPQPSAWERIALGWTSPILAPPGSSTFRLPAVGLRGSGPDTVYKVPVSAKEYFLVENRNRDGRNNGVTLTVRWGGSEFTKSFAKDDPHFNAAVVDSVYGTVVDIDELDWSLPGADGFPGGVLLWHVDEAVIEKNLRGDSINTDPNHRGVDLEEADGSQDIGQSYGLLDPGSGSEDGSPLDYWFKKNISPVYRNEFGENTNPNSLSYSFARSHVTLDQFSDADSIMTFRARIGDATVSLLRTLKRDNIKLGPNDAPLFVGLDGSGSPELLYTAGDSVYLLKDGLTPYFNNGTGIFSSFGGRFQPAFLKKSGNPSDGGMIVGVRDSTVILFNSQDFNGDGYADTVLTVNVGARISTPPATFFIEAPLKRWMIFVGDASGYLDEISIFDLAVRTPGTIVVNRSRVSSYPVIAFTYIPSTGSWIAAAKDSIRNSLSVAKGFGGKTIESLSAWQSAPPAGASGIVLLDDNTLVVFDGASLLQTSSFPVDGVANPPLTVADVNGDGLPDLLVGTGKGLYAYNYNGVLIENFPYRPLDRGVVAGGSTILRLNGSTSAATLFGSSNGQINAYDANGRPLDGFPLPTGGLVSPPVFSRGLFAAASTDSNLYIWRFAAIFDSVAIPWNGFLTNEYHLNCFESSAPLASRSAELLPSAFAYNWPNPVYDKVTNIRYYLNRSATVGIKIYNMAGELVDELTGPGYANLDNEVPWNVAKVQSGVYFAQIKASASGEEKSVVIKIAVVK